jgi:hypothetical protein
MSDPADRALPDLRASDADRERTAELLRYAAGDGQLSMDELGDRLDDAYAARTRAELARLTGDLQAPGAVAAEPAGGSGLTVRRGPGGARWLVAIMSGCERSGRWRLSERVTSINFMGGSELDLTDAELASDRVELTVYSIMGGAEIRVPAGLTVEVSELALMGGNSVKLPTRRPGSGPVLFLRLVSVMGGAEVKLGPKRSRRERKALEAERRRHLGH